MTAVLTTPPSAARIALARTGLELRLFARERQLMVFTFVYPVVMLVIFASLMGEDTAPGGIPFPQYFLPGIAATGIMLISFSAVATSIAGERESGQLERLQLLGAPPVAYFAGKGGQVLVTVAAQLAVLLPVARYGYDVPLPVDLGHWVTFAWVAALGALAGTVLGIAASGLGGSASSVSTTVLGLGIVLQFFSGVFFAFPVVWFLVPSALAGVPWTVVLAVASTLGPFLAWTRGDEPLWGPGETLVGLVFSLAMGLWVHAVLARSEERAALIRALEATRAELAEAHRAQGVLGERERLAREVHDTLAQGFTSIVVLAQTATTQLPGSPGAAAERVALIEEVARENLAEARAMVAAFGPVALDSTTLVEALERLVERFGRETGLATRLDTAALGDAGAGLTRGQEVVLLRGAQEALTNVRRHAGASAVVLRVSRVGDVVAVHVEDDGVGFDPAGAPGFGLAGLRDRAAEVGGALDVASAPGRGTRVTVRVPGR